MLDKEHCALCGRDEDELIGKGLAMTVVRSPDTGAIVCSTCIKGVHAAVLFTEKLMEEALDESHDLALKGERRNDKGECNCPKHIFERKRAAALADGNKHAKMIAEEVKEADPLPEVPVSATVH